MSDTPRTDQMEQHAYWFDDDMTPVCESRFVRPLEMELIAAQQRIKRLESDAISDAISAKWMWMMNYCKAHGFSPTLGWESAEKAWTAAFEAKESKP